MIREATAEDVPRLVEMGRNFLAGTKYGALISENPGQMRTLLETLMGNPAAVVFVAINGNGKLFGMIGAILYPHHISGEKIAGEVFWWVEPEERSKGTGLLRRFEDWARESGATTVQMVAPTESIAGIYRALGYEYAESTYQRRL